MIDESDVLEVLMGTQPMNPRDSLNEEDKFELEVLVYPVRRENASRH